MFVTRGDDNEGEVGRLDRIAISPSFPYLLCTIFRSSNASPLPDIFGDLEMVEIVLKRLHQEMAVIQILHVLSSVGCTGSTRVLDCCFGGKFKP